MTKTTLAISEVADDLDAYVASTRREAEPPPRISIWEPTATGSPTPSPSAIPIEQELIAVIVKTIAAGEGHRDGNDRKERELMALLDKLTPAQSLALGKRLSCAKETDPLVSAFGRLVVERRVRLLGYLARRRAIAVTLAQRPSRG